MQPGSSVVLKPSFIPLTDSLLGRPFNVSNDFVIYEGVACRTYALSLLLPYSTLAYPLVLPVTPSDLVSCPCTFHTLALAQILSFVAFSRRTFEDMGVVVTVSVDGMCYYEVSVCLGTNENELYLACIGCRTAFPPSRSPVLGS